MDEGMIERIKVQTTDCMEKTFLDEAVYVYKDIALD